MTLGIIVGLAGLVLLLVAGVPVGLTMLISGLAGMLVGFGPETGMMYLSASLYREAASFSLLVIPMFLLMGALGSYGKLWERLFAFVYAVVGRVRGGMHMAIVSAGALLGATTGSSTGNAAALGKIAVAESEQYGYEKKTTLACVAASSTAAVMIPPSITLIVYALLTETSVARLFAAGVVPGVVSALTFMVLISLLARRRPDDFPRGPRFPIREQVTQTVRAAPIIAVFVLVIGGIYVGLYTPTEAGAVGVLGVGIAGLVLGRLKFPQLFAAAREAAQTTSMIFLIIIGAFVFGRFMSASKIPQNFVEMVGSLPVNRYVVLIILLLIYLLLGAFMDQLAIQVLTIPIVFPLITSLGFDPYWFAIVFVKTVEIGLITPPLGLNVYVVSGVAKVPVEQGFSGIKPFLTAEVAQLALLVAFPSISLWLPDLLGAG